MKHNILWIFFIFTFPCYAQSQQILDKPRVDERVELLSIVFRLAGCSEYSSKNFKLYADRIQKHFAPFKDHELIRYTKEIRNSNGIGFDAVMGMAVHIGPAPDFKPLVPFSKNIPESRWGKPTALKFISLLTKFYMDANCAAFFADNAALYREAEQRFLPVYQFLDLKWYKDFYGKEPKEHFKIIIGLGNGGGNYGPNLVYPNGDREVYAIMGTWSADSTGMAKFDLMDYFPTLLHEFNHSFVNYLTDLNRNALKKNGEKIYAVVKKQMMEEAYAYWETMISEATVRAAVIKYMKDHRFTQSEIDTETNDQLSRGFYWINPLVEELQRYDKQRDKYPTLESYMPNIVKAYDYYATHRKEILDSKGLPDKAK